MSRPSEVYVRPLTPIEHEWVHRLYQDTTSVLLKTRCHITLLSAERYSVSQIATLFFLSQDTVARCVHEFNEEGLKGILPDQRGAGPRKVTSEYLKTLFELAGCQDEVSRQVEEQAVKSS